MNKLFCIYQSQPEQIVLELTSNGIVEHKSPSIRWQWGPIRGGTVPIHYCGKFLRFFHSALDNEAPVWRRRYYVGAMLMSAKPPFTPVAISSRPILRGSELDDLPEMERSSCFHFKPKVVFPAGVITHNDGWLLSIGVNDSACALVEIKEKDLNL